MKHKWLIRGEGKGLVWDKVKVVDVGEKVKGRCGVK